MRNSTKRRSTSVAIAIAGVATLATTILLHRGTSPLLGSWFAIAIALFFVTLSGIVATVVFHVHVRWQHRLRRGDKRLAQWTLSQAEWEQFRVNDTTWRKSGRPNSLKFRKERSANGVEVLIAQNALMVDDDFYSLGALRGLQWIPETPPSLEYNMVTHAKNRTIKWNIRLPVAADAEVQARAVWDYVHRPVPSHSATNVNRLRFIRSAGLVCAVLSAFALLLTRSSYVNREQSPVLWVFLTAFAGLPFGLFLAALCHWQLRSFKRGLPPA